MTRVISLSRHRTLRSQASQSDHILTDFDFSSAYQPILSPTHQKLVGFEALVRVTRDQQPVSPAELFNHTNSVQQTVELDSFLLHRHLERFSFGIGHLTGNLPTPRRYRQTPPQRQQPQSFHRPSLSPLDGISIGSRATRAQLSAVRDFRDICQIGSSAVRMP